MRSSVAGYNAAEVTKAPLWPHFHLDERSSMHRLDQSASHAEYALVLMFCKLDMPPVFLFVWFFFGGGLFLQISDPPTFPYRYIYIKRWLRVNQVFNI